MINQSSQIIINTAISILADELKTNSKTFTSAEQVKTFLTLNMSSLEHEVFSVLFLSNQHALVSYEVMFNGTIAEAAIYPREIIKKALAHNAAAVILAHNHPSGIPEPSEADKMITTQIAEGLSYVDVRVLDHIIIGGVDAFSFAERGLL